LRLLDPDRYYDLEKFIAEQKSYTSLNEVVQQLLAIHPQTADAIPGELAAQLANYLPGETLNDLQQLARSNLKQAIDQTINYLLDRHGTGRVLLRNTRSSVAGFPERHLHQHGILLTAE